jgi:hypothetical protein
MDVMHACGDVIQIFTLLLLFDSSQILRSRPKLRAIFKPIKQVVP